MTNLETLKKILHSFIENKLNIPIRTDFFILISPLIFIYGNWKFHSVFYILLFLFFLKDKILFENYNVNLPYISIWLLNLIWGWYILYKTTVLSTGLYYYVALFLSPFLIFVIIQNTEFNVDFFRNFFNLMILSGIILSIFHIYTLIEYGFSYEKRIVSNYLWPDNNILAAYYMIVFFIALSFLMNSHKGESKIYYIISIILILFAIFLTQTRGVWLSLIFAMSVYLIKKPKLIIPITIIFLAFFLFFADVIITRFLTIKNFTTDLSALGRLQAWIGTLSLLKDNYLTGYGFNAWMSLRDSVYGFYLVPVIHSHNTYLNNLLEIGLIGCIFYYFFFFKSILINFKIWKSSVNNSLKKYSDGLFLSFIGLSSAFMFEPYMSTFSSSVIVIWFLIAVSFKLNELNKQKEKIYS